jgi:hypothetical protein
VGSASKLQQDQIQPLNVENQPMKPHVLEFWTMIQTMTRVSQKSMTMAMMVIWIILLRAIRAAAGVTALIMKKTMAMIMMVMEFKTIPMTSIMTMMEMDSQTIHIQNTQIMIMYTIMTMIMMGMVNQIIAMLSTKETMIMTIIATLGRTMHFLQILKQL